MIDKIQIANSVKVRDDHSLVRDPVSNGIVNVDMDAYNSHIAMKRARSNIDARLSILESNVSEIKDMFSRILDKLDK